MRLECHAVFVELAQLSQRHHLEAARIGQDRMRPVHHGVQPAQPGHAFGTRPQHEVVGIAQQDIGARRAHLLGIHALDGSGSADRHEGRRANEAARRRDAAGSGSAVRCVQGKAKRGRAIARHVSAPGNSRQESP